MKEQLRNELIMAAQKGMDDDELDEFKDRLTMILSNYDIAARETHLALRDMLSVLPKADKPAIIDWNNCHTSEQLDSISTTKNDLGVDAISRKALLDATVKKNSVWNIITNSEGDNLETIIAKLSSVTPQPRVDFKELKRKILMEVDGGTDDAWLAYGEVCDRISNSIDEFVADMSEVKA